MDHFKSYNDAFSHPAGDVALVALANLLKIQMKRG
ncbi:diguanylate cyclase domain-containing protein [Colwellia marinimaniae]